MIVVGTTLHAFAMHNPDQSLSGLMHAEAIADSVDGHEVRFFAALETDARGRDVFAPLRRRLDDAGVGHDEFWFSLDDGADEITTANRLRRITMGQNLANSYAQEHGADWLLFCAADCAPPPDVLPKLLELDHPICGPEIPTYCLSGPEPMIDSAFPGLGPLYPDFPVQEHMASAACILLARSVFAKLSWRVDRDEGWSDDPALWHDAQDLLGLPTYVRKDVIAQHYPECIGSMETRYPKHLRKVQR